MVRSAPTCVESKDRHNPSFSPIFGTLGESCPCGCGGRTFRWAKGAPLEVCFQKMAGVRELILRAPLPPVQKHLLHVFLHHARDQRECWPSEQRLLLATGVRSRQTLSTHKKALKDLGILDWLRPEHPDNPRSCSLYRLSWEALQALVEERMQASFGSNARTTPRTSRVALAAGAPAGVPAAKPTEVPVPATTETTLADAPALQVPEATESAEVVAQEPQMSCPAFEDLTLTLDEALLGPCSSMPPAVEESTVLLAVGPCEPEPEPVAPVMLPADLAPSVEPAAPVREPSAPALASLFEVPLMLVWNLWREAYLTVYGRPYIQTFHDRSASQEIARACAAAVLHHEQRAGLAPSERETQASLYLAHIFAAFLRRPGRKDFLRERRHPLSLLPADLNELGEPWSKERKVAPEPAPLPPPLPREEQLARCRQLKQALTEARVTTRPRILKSG